MQQVKLPQLISGLRPHAFARKLSVKQSLDIVRSPLLKLKYNNAIADAVADLGRPEEIGKTFAGFQKYLYQQQAAA